MTETEAALHTAVTAILDVLTAQGYGDQLADARAQVEALAPPPVVVAAPEPEPAPEATPAEAVPAATDGAAPVPPA